MAEPDHGIDLYGYDDITPSFRVVDGRLGLMHALARRLLTPRGSLFYDSDYGTDVRVMVNGTGDVNSMRSAIERELVKDERVNRVAATVVESAGGTFSATVGVVDGAGPFQLTLAISEVTVELLKDAT